MFSSPDYWYGPLPSQPILLTPDCRITIIDKVTLAIARKLLDRIEKEMLSNETSSSLRAENTNALSAMMSDIAKIGMPLTATENNNRPADFNLEQESKKPRYSRSGPYKPRTKK